jgi:cysteine synthase A
MDSSRANYANSAHLAESLGGHFMDQFTYAERVADWRGNNNIAESIFEQMSRKPHPEPTWVVCGAETGGTSSTIGRYLRYIELDTQLCVVDPENSVFHEYYHGRDRTLVASTDLTANLGWPGLAQVFRLEHTWRERGAAKRVEH